MDVCNLVGLRDVGEGQLSVITSHIQELLTLVVEQY